MNDPKEKEEKKKFSPRPLLQLIPAVVVAGAIVFTLPFTGPVLDAVPDRLTASAIEPEQAAQESTAAALDAPLLPYADGTYEGSSQGYGGLVKVRVTMSGGRITAVEILDASGETASFFSRAQKVIDAVLEQQTWEVDVVSGATYSSRGILGAIQNALTGEAVQNAAAEKVTAVASLTEEAFEEPAAYKDGTYTGSATGFGGTITVSVTISGGKITDVSILDASGETASYFARAKSVASAIVSSGTPNVDTVSGATYSSNGIINAVKRALSQAAADGSSADLVVDEKPAEPDPMPVPVPSNPDAMPAESYKDGVYTGSGEGYGGEIQVQVTVSGGRIAAIDVLSAEKETFAYFNRAKVMLINMIATQSTGVDAITGATYSSEGLRDAVNEALSQAKANPDPAPAPDPDPTPTPDPTPAPTGTYTDGTYTGTAQGYGGDITVQITVADGKISNAEITGAEGETEEYLTQASALTEQIVTAQTAEVDVITGATESSSGILAASRSALAQAAGLESIYQDGTYTAIVDCADEAGTFTYQVQVEVTIENGVITHLTATRINDTSENPDENESYFDNAIYGRSYRKVWYKGVVGQVLAKQSVSEEDVDTVSRATYSSDAILSGAAKALEQASGSQTGEDVTAPDTEITDTAAADSVAAETDQTAVEGSAADADQSVPVETDAAAAESNAGEAQAEEAQESEEPAKQQETAALSEETAEPAGQEESQL